MLLILSKKHGLIVEQQPCEDTISRQAAIDVIDAVFPVDPLKSEYAQGIACGAALAKTYVEQLPSAQPKRKKGKWMKEDRGHVEYCAVCDQCGFDWIWSDREYFKFCPNCGADMRGEQDG